MEFVKKKLTKKEIVALTKKFGSYVKLTVDIENRWLVVGSELHADAERILLEKGSKQDSIWGGGIDFAGKKVDGTAVLNLRPHLSNDNLEILDPGIRKEFFEIVEDFFEELWR